MKFCEGVIRSAARMTYTEVHAILEGDEEVRARYAHLAAEFELMRDLAVLDEQAAVKSAAASTSIFPSR